MATVIAILADENLVCDDQVGHNGGIFRIDRGLDLDKQESEATHKLRHTTDIESRIT